MINFDQLINISSYPPYHKCDHYKKTLHRSIEQYTTPHNCPRHTLPQFFGKHRDKVCVKWFCAAQRTFVTYRLIGLTFRLITQYPIPGALELVVSTATKICFINKGE